MHLKDRARIRARVPRRGEPLSRVRSLRLRRLAAAHGRAPGDPLLDGPGEAGRRDRTRRRRRTADPAARLPLTIALPIPKGAPVMWAERSWAPIPPRIRRGSTPWKDGGPVYDLAAMTVSKARKGQVEVELPARPRSHGDKRTVTASVTVPYRVGEARLVLRMPPGGKLVSSDPKTPGVKGPGGYTYFGVSRKGPAAGTVLVDDTDVLGRGTDRGSGSGRVVGTAPAAGLGRRERDGAVGDRSGYGVRRTSGSSLVKRRRRTATASDREDAPGDE